MTDENATTAEKYQAYNDSCKELRYLAASYDACTLALLWCGVPDDELEEERNLCTKVGPNGLLQGVFNHPKNLCVKVKTQILARAMESNQIKFSRDGGLEGYLKDIGHVAWDRRQITGNSLKSFLMEYYPQEKPSFLFNEFERGINENITIESYQTLEAERDALKVRLDKAAEVWRNQKERIEELEEKAERPVSTSQRRTLLTIIAALCDYSEIDPQARGAGQRIAEMTQKTGAPITAETIKKYLDEIPDATESRMK